MTPIADPARKFDAHQWFVFEHLCGYPRSMTRRPAHPLQEQIADSLGVRRVQEQIADSLGLRRVLNHVQDQIRAAALVGPAAVHEQIIGSLGPTRMTDVLAAADALSTALQDVGELDRELGCPAADFLTFRRRCCGQTPIRGRAVPSRDC